MRAARLAFFMVALGAFPAYPSAQQSADSAVARLRTLFLQRDFETAALDGQKLAATSDSTELKAWFLLNLARSGRTDEALAAARQMQSSKPDDPWSLVALAGALHYKTGLTAEAIDTATKALERFPGNRDVIWLRGQTLAADPKRREEALVFIESQRPRIENPAEITVTKGYLLYTQYLGPPRDEAKLKAALETFEEARRIDPASVNAHYLPATYLNQLKRADEARALLVKALSLAPGSVDVRRAYWTSITNSTELSAEKKRADLDADVRGFLEKNGNRPGALSAVASIARTAKMPEIREVTEDKMLKDFNDSPEAEWIFVERWREQEGPADASRKTELRAMYSEYVARPKHHHTGLLGEAYRELFFLLVEDQSVSGDELYRVATGMVKYENNNPHITVVRGPIALAERKTHLEEAERMARDGIEVLRKKVESQRSFYDTPGEYERATESMTARGHDALGWVLFLRGRTDEAEKELLKSYELNHDDRDNLHHLGKFYEAKNDLARAEEFYVKGLAVQSPSKNPSEASLRALYAKRNGSDAGYDGYLGKLREADRDKRQERILAARVAKPEAASAFSLKNLAGNRVSLDSLKGKVVVINFWGIWCGWCVQEMPDFQKLHEKYANDPDVVILTIDNDANPDDVPPWMKKKGYTFPVLLDDGYVSNKARITAFPTTWFLDREGRKAFVKVGWSEKLLEEFAWRIEAVRTETSAAAAGR